MNSITVTYPGFQALPKGIKQMLVVSESLFFEDAGGSPKRPAYFKSELQTPNFELRFGAVQGLNGTPVPRGLRMKRTGETPVPLLHI
ncbi:MAG TPA: hypothetical protein VL970_12270 [Candidatus Acidoferrales bacterium]|nr:hypothetical protein [Candidatus Acidoferrales bacterium]